MKTNKKREGIYEYWPSKKGINFSTLSYIVDHDNMIVWMRSLKNAHIDRYKRLSLNGSTEIDHHYVNYFHIFYGKHRWEETMHGIKCWSRRRLSNKELFMEIV